MSASPWILGEADAYAERNADAEHRDRIGHLLERPVYEVLDLGGGNGWRADWIRNRNWTVVDGRIGDGTGWIKADLETYDIPAGYDLAIFGYVLHWLSPASGERLLTQALDRCGLVAIEDFYPDQPIDVPYAHREGIVTRKRRYGEILARAGGILVAETTYRYHGEPDGEWCRAEVWRKA